jgi:hypothetical protein
MGCQTHRMQGHRMNHDTTQVGNCFSCKSAIFPSTSYSFYKDRMYCTFCVEVHKNYYLDFKEIFLQSYTGPESLADKACWSAWEQHKKQYSREKQRSNKCCHQKKY